MTEQELDLVIDHSRYLCISVVRETSVYWGRQDNLVTFLWYSTDIQYNNKTHCNKMQME